MPLSSVQKGNIIESQIANTLILISEGRLCPSIPIVDDSGIDLIVNKKNSFKAIFVQVKSRFVTNARYENRLDFQVKRETFSVSDNFFILCVYFDTSKSEIDTMWLIPSTEIIKSAVKVKNEYRIVANRGDRTNDKWSKYKVDKVQLVSRLNMLL